VTQLGAKGGFKKWKPRLFGEELPYPHQFRVVYHNGRWAKAMNDQSFTENNKGIHYFHKLENHITTFFKQQFTKMQIEETQSINNGLLNDNDT
jgi:hypothetical protein